MMPIMYKIVAKALAMRLGLVLSKNYLASTWIHHNTFTAMIGIEYATTTQQECILLQLDLDIAYDRVGWLFVSRTTKDLGFGPKMSSTVMILCEGSSSQLLFNKRIVRTSQVKRSIRPGCPLAPPLFAMCSHSLAI